jgi:hypothetical protein
VRPWRSLAEARLKACPTYTPNSPSILQRHWTHA